MMTQEQRDILILQDVVPFEKGQRVTITFGAADTDYLIAHTLGADVYYVVLQQDRAGSLYKSPLTVQQAKQLILRSSAATLTATLLLWEQPS